MERTGPTGLSKANMLTALERELGGKKLCAGMKASRFFADRAGNCPVKAASKLEEATKMVDVDDVTWSSPAELKKWNLRHFSQKCMVVLGDAATRHISCTECRAATI